MLQDLDKWIQAAITVRPLGSNGSADDRYPATARRGVHELAAQTAGSACGPWRMAESPALSYALPNAYFDCSRTYLTVLAASLTSRTAVYGPVRTVVWEGAGREARPYPDFSGYSPSILWLPLTLFLQVKLIKNYIILHKFKYLLYITT